MTEAAVSVDRMRASSPSDLARSFASWPKPAELFVQYAEATRAGRSALLVAYRGDDAVGFCVVHWVSGYAPFAAHGIPEISDLNVLPHHRGKGAGRALLAFAENVVSERSREVGVLVGLYPDYGRAQHMYVHHGYVPDGRGLLVNGVAVAPGTLIVLDDDVTIALVRTLSPATD